MTVWYTGLNSLTWALGVGAYYTLVVMGKNPKA